MPQAATLQQATKQTVAHHGFGESGMRQHTEQGSTLVEVIISIVVIAVLGAALATFLMTSASAVDRNRQQSVASQLTERAMEKARYTLASTGKCDPAMQMGGDIAEVDGMVVSEKLTCPATGDLPVAT